MPLNRAEFLAGLLTLAAEPGRRPIKGDRPADPASADEGEPVFQARSGGRHRNLNVRDIGNGLVRVSGPVTGLTVEDVDVVNAYRALHERTTQQFGNVPFLFLGVKPSPTRPHIEGPAREANRRIAEEVARRPNARFIDVDAAMRGPDGRPMLHLWAEDGVHLSRDGYELWTRLLAEHRDFVFG